MFDKIADESRASIEKDDLKILLPIVAKIEPKNILEIGTWKGYGAETWINAFEPKHFLTIESETFESLKPIMIHNMNYIYSFGKDSHSPEAYAMVKRIHAGHKTDFLFIDGDHSESGVRQDFEMYAPLVRKGGIIAFHDVIYSSPDPLAPVMVKPLWEELKQKYPYVEIKASKKSTGIGVIWNTNTD